MNTTVTGPGTLVFWWKASSYSNLSFGTFLVDGVAQPGSISGEAAWQPQSYFLPAGTHTLRWSYTNNSAIVSLTNGIWVDQVAFTAGMIAPAIAEPPADVLIAQGFNAVFAAEATGTPPLSYQWFRNNVSLGTIGTNAILTLTNVSPIDSG